MNLGVIAKTNTKGQIVIPKKFRDELGIDQNVLLNLVVRGNSIYVTPLEKSAPTPDTRKIYIEILKRTAGTWRTDDWKETEAKRRQIEIKVSKKRKDAW